VGVLVGISVGEDVSEGVITGLLTGGDPQAAVEIIKPRMIIHQNFGFGMVGYSF
jgi:hypothetical protein